MKHSCIVIILLFLIVKTSVAQTSNIKIKWGELLRENKGSFIEKIIPAKNGNFYVKRVKESSITSFNIADKDKLRYTLQQYNSKLKKTSSIDLFKALKGKQEYVEDIFWHYDKLIMLTQHLNKAEKKYQLIIRKLSGDKLSLEGDKIVFKEIDYDWTLGRPTLDYRISKDSTKLMLLYNLPNKRNNEEKIGYSILNKNLKPITERTLTIPIKDRFFEIEGYEVANSGEMVVWGNEFFNANKSLTITGKPNFQTSIFYTHPKEPKILNRVNVKDTELFVSQIQLAYTNNNQLIGVGFYSTENTETLKGTLYIKINKKEAALRIEQKSDLSIEALVEGLSEAERKKLIRRKNSGKSAELSNFVVDQLLLREDGGAILIAEEYFESNYSRGGTGFYSGPFGTNQRETVTNYHHNDILIINLNPDGTIGWSKKVPKKQNSTDGGYYASYAPAIIYDKLHLFYNDHAKNLFKENTDKKDRTYNLLLNSDAVFAMSVISPQGNLKQLKLFRAGESEVFMRPQVIQQISANEILIYGDKQRKTRFGKIVF